MGYVKIDTWHAHSHALYTVGIEACTHTVTISNNNTSPSFQHQ